MEAPNTATALCKNTVSTGLRFIPLDTATICLAVFVNAGFATNKEPSSQLGFLIVLMSCRRKCNIIHYGGVKSKRVTRSVLEAELFAMTHGFDIAYTICLAVNDIYGKIVPMKFYADSHSLFD